jgi:hypothetical protein
MEGILMVTLLPWSSVELGDIEVFAPSPPALVVYTWYIDGEPESTVTYFWHDETTGLINHELVFAEPVGFEVALAWAQEHAPKRGVERIHIKHGPSRKKNGHPAVKVRRRVKRAPRGKVAARAQMARAKKHGRKR